MRIKLFPLISFVSIASLLLIQACSGSSGGGGGTPDNGQSESAITSLVFTVSGIDQTIDFDDNRQAIVYYPYGSTLVDVIVKAIGVASDATSDYNAGDNIIVTDGKVIITTTDQDGIEQIYTINLVEAKNSEAAITSLTLKLIDPSSDSSRSISFDGTTDVASVTYKYSQDTTQDTTPDTIIIQLTSIAMSYGAIATITINDKTTDGSGNLPIDIGISGSDSSVDIVVTAEDGSSETYTVTISLSKVEANTLTEITDLDISLTSALDHTFDIQNIAFNENSTATVSVEFPYGTSEIDFPASFSIANIVTSDGATASVAKDDFVNIDNSQDSRTATITVMAQDASTQQEYTIHFMFTIAKNTEANIDALAVSVSGVDHTIDFDANREATVDYPYSATALSSITVKSISLSADATAITADNPAIADNSTVSVINDKVTIAVTAQDGRTIQTYTIHLVQAQPSNAAEITSLIVNVSGADHTIDFGDNREATVNYPYSTTAPSSVIVKSIGISAEATANVSDDQTVDLADGKITITVTAQDGTTVQTYTINLVQAQPSNAADITSLIVTASGVNHTIGFDANREATVYYPYSATALSSVTVKEISVSAEATTNVSNDQTVDLADGKITITVTAQDGTSQQTYTINLVMLDSTGADITSLIVTVLGTDHTIGFDPSREATVDYPYSATALSSVIVKSISLSADATSDYGAGATINVANDKVTITVTAQNGTNTTQTYTINLVMLANTAADITSLVVTVSGADHTVLFDTNGEATVDYPYSATALLSVIVKSIGISAEATANVSDDQTVDLADGKITITVTAQDGTSTQTYTINLVMLANTAADITSLVISVSGADHTVDFGDNTQATVNYLYQATALTSVIVKAISVSDQATVSTAKDATIDVASGTATITVTAQDGTSTQTYTINLVMAANTASDITSLVVTVSGADHTVDFGDNTQATVNYLYQATALTSVIVKAISVSDQATVSTAKDATIDVASGTATITVTAQDGTSTQSYTINLVMAANTASDITSLVVSVSGADHTVDFGDNTQATVNYLYQATALTSVIVKAISVSDQATVSTAKDATIDVASGTATITVTAQDGTSTQTYTINLVMSANTAADITSLVVTVSGADHTIGFDSSGEATVDYPYSATALSSVIVKSIGISAEATSDYGTGATIDVSNNQVTITVTAQDATSTQTYTINLVMSANTAADITSLVVTVSGADHTIGFDSSGEATVDYPYSATALSSVIVKSIAISAEATSDYGAGATIDVSNNQATITVTAQDGTTSQTYTINLVMLANTAADITSLELTVSGADHTVSFDDNMEATVDYLYSATALSNVTVKSIIISAEATSDYGTGATINVSNNQVTITVTAQDGSTIQMYTIRFVELPASSEAAITSLVVNVSGTDHTIDFDANSEATVDYPYSATALSSVTVNAINVSAEATSDYGAGATIDVSNNQATITVTAQDGTTSQTYTINLVMLANTAADITSLIVTVSGVDHTIGFDSSGEATVDYPYSATALSSVIVKSIGISAEATSDYGTGATINVANDKITITVTAQDGTTSQTYTINLVMLANTAADITSLVVSVSGVDHTIDFGDNTEATVDYPYSATALSSVTVNAISVSAEATSDYGAGATINVVTDKVTITVTAQDGTSTQSYTINLVMLANTAADITSLLLTVSGADYTVGFDASGEATVDYLYSATALSSVIVKSISISAEATSDYATGATINVANDKVTITVTAQDGTSTQTYTINLAMSANTAADITSLVVNVSGVDHTIDFGDNTEATVDYPYSATALSSVTVNAISVSAEATSDYDGGETINVTDGKATITVTAQDGTSTQTYTINLAMSANTAANITSLVLTVSVGVDQTIDFGDNLEATIDYPYSVGTISSVTVKAISVSVGATSEYGAGATINVANDQASITVTAQDESTVQIYNMTFVKIKASLMDILDPSLGTSTVPTDFAIYDELTRSVLAPYNANATLVARYVTISGGAAPQGGLSWSDAAPASELKSTLDNISDASASKVYLIFVASGATADASYDAGSTMDMKNHVAIIGGWQAGGGWDRSGTTVLSGGNSHRVLNGPGGLTDSSLLYGLTIAAGSAVNSQGGGMNTAFSSPTLTNVIFSGNSATNGTGGGLYHYRGTPIMTNVTFAGNSAREGGGMYSNNGVVSPMTNVTFSGNTATRDGGGLFGIFSVTAVTNVTFADNSARNGGGAYIVNSTLDLTNATFSGNRSTSGGGVYGNGSDMDLTNATFSGNRSTNGGGGIANNSGRAPMILTNVTFSDNSADNYGGGISTDNTHFVLTNTTFMGNSSSIGGGIYIGNRKVATIVNSIFWGNTASTVGAQIYSQDATGDQISLAYSVIEGGAPAGADTTTTNLVTTDPSLADLTTDADSSVATHAISTGSSAINAGVYVRRNGYDFYYSTDNDNWYSDFTSDTATGLTDLTSDTVAEHADSIDITATDATSTARSDRPDAGAYEAR